jgi:hypothetical protein
MRKLLPAIAAIAGLALLVWSLRSAGVSSVIEGIRRVGAGFIVIFLLGAFRHLARAVVWTLCFDDRHSLTIGHAFRAYVAGDAVGNVTPFGVLASEPSKVVFVRERIDTHRAIAALALENLFYGATVLLVLVAGTAALLAIVPATQSLRTVSLATLAGAVACAAIGVWLMVARVRIVSAVVRGFGRDPARARDIEDQVFGFSAAHPWRLAPIALIELAYHAAAVFEIWFVVRLITGTAPSVMTAFVLEYVNRTITVVFQFVPLWIGVDEAGTALVTSTLGIGRATGVSLALARKARILTWTAIGIVMAAPYVSSLTRGRPDRRNIGVTRGV